MDRNEINKMSRIEDIFEKLQPNTYTDEHSSWNTLQKGLLKMSIEELNWLYILILCKREG